MTSTVYRAAPALQVVDYDEESVVFNPITWDTHVLNAAAAEVLSMCTGIGCTVEQIAQALTLWLQADEAPQALDHAIQTVDVLKALKLVDELTQDEAA